MLDNTDLKIIELLNRDGRMPLTQIGSELGISHVTAKNRLEHMVARGVLEVRGYVDPGALGLTTEVVVGVKADLAKVSALARELASLYEVTFTAIVTGRYDVMITVSVESDQEFLTFIQSKLSKLDGVKEIEAFHILSFEKRRVQWRVPRGIRNGARKDSRPRVGRAERSSRRDAGRRLRSDGNE